MMKCSGADGMKSLNEEYEVCRRLDHYLYSRRTRFSGDSCEGMFFFAVSETGVDEQPHNVVVGFVPNEDVEEIGVCGGDYVRLGVFYNGDGGVHQTKVHGSEARESLLDFSRKHFRESIERHLSHSRGSGELHPSADGVFKRFLG